MQSAPASGLSTTTGAGRSGEVYEDGVLGNTREAERHAPKGDSIFPSPLFRGITSRNRTLGNQDFGFRLIARRTLPAPVRPVSSPSWPPQGTNRGSP